MAVLRMSTEELSRVETLVQVASGRLAVTEAARIMGITRRHAHRLLVRRQHQWHRFEVVN
jgi:predicted HTH domain antitoxin